MNQSPQEKFQRFRPYLDQPRKQGAITWSFCPAHADGKSAGSRGKPLAGRSLALDPNKGLKCFAGCQWKALYEAFKARGLDQEKAPPLPPKPRYQGRPAHAKMVDEYEYREEDGALFAYKGRWEWADPESPKGHRKDHAWRLPDSATWSGLGAGAVIPLYRAETLRDADRSRRVFWVEGERKADALIARNELAVSAPNGASSKLLPEQMAIFKGRTIIIMPDNDDPGRKFAGRVRQAIDGIAAHATVWTPGDLPETGDIIDFFNAGRSLDEYVAPAEKRLSAYVLQPDGTIFADRPLLIGSISFEAVGIRKDRFGVHATVTLSYGDRILADDTFNVQGDGNRTRLAKSAHLMLNEVEADGYAHLELKRDLDAFCRGLFKASVGAVAVTYSQGTEPYYGPELYLGHYITKDAGTIIYGRGGGGKSTMALGWALSLEYGCSALWHVPERRRVLYINLERAEAVFDGRRQAMCRILGLPEDSMLRFLHAKGKKLEALADALHQIVQADAIDVIVLDSISASTSGDLKEDSTANAIVAILHSLGVAWVAIGHHSHNDDTHPFGSAAFVFAADIIIQVASTANPQNTQLTVSLKIIKANDVPKGQPKAWTLIFEEDSPTVVDIIPVAGQVADKPRRDDLAGRIRDFLGRNGAASPVEIANGIGGAGAETVSRTLRGKPDLFVRIHNPAATYQQWGLLAHGEEPGVRRYTWDNDIDKCRLCGAPTAGIYPLRDGVEGTYCAAHLAAMRGEESA